MNDALRESDEDLLTIIARSIGRTMFVDNFHQRARDVLNSLKTENRNIPQPSRIGETGMKDHTPTPWNVWRSPEGVWGVRAVYKMGDFRYTTWPAICDCGTQPNEENAKFIVEACNNYYILKARVSELETLLKEKEG